MSLENIDRAKHGSPLRSRFDLKSADGLKSALRDIYPPDEAAEASFDRLLCLLSKNPTAHGVKSALRESFPPALDPEASFDRLLGNLSDQPGSHVPTRSKKGRR